MLANKTFQELLSLAVGETPPLDRDANTMADRLLDSGGIGYSQLNEMLLLLGLDRISLHFFQYLVDGDTSYQPGSAITSLGQLRAGVERFLKYALLKHGNIRHAFKWLSTRDGIELAEQIAPLDSVDEEHFRRRHAPAEPIDEIRGEDTYYMGYLCQREIRERLAANPTDGDAQREDARRQTIEKRGMRNHEAYLASDHMDVYVATSMRERHEFYLVHQVVAGIFGNELLKPLKLRWFDPTQAYCSDRIDKGLSEALMLKRASCTLYFAQESDTLGKDSELACTLAQGKPVVAFVPDINSKNERRVAKWILEAAQKLYPKEEQPGLILKQLQVYAAQSAWSDKEVQGWVANPTKMPLDKAKRRLMEFMKKHYDSRAATLKESHPLGLQVHLETGVANGVLVARTTDECATLIHRIMTNQLELRLDEQEVNGRKYIFLRESITNSIFRVVTGDKMLTNAFWNYYLR